MQERGAELVLARLRVLLDEADRRSVCRMPCTVALRQPQLTGELDDAEPAVAARQQPEDRRGALDRLDRAGNGRNRRRTLDRTAFDIVGREG